MEAFFLFTFSFIIFVSLLSPQFLSTSVRNTQNIYDMGVFMCLQFIGLVMDCMVPVDCSCMHGPDKASSPIGSFWSPQLLLPSHMPTFFQSNCLQPNKDQDEELASEDMNRLTLHLIMIT